MYHIAQDGYLTVMPAMPVNMAVFNPNIANTIMTAHQFEIRRLGAILR